MANFLAYFARELPGQMEKVEQSRRQARLDQIQEEQAAAMREHRMALAEDRRAAAEARQEKIARANQLAQLRAGIDVYAPDALQSALRAGDLETANLVLEAQLRQTRDAMAQASGELRNILDMKDPNARAKAYSSARARWVTQYPTLEQGVPAEFDPVWVGGFLTRADAALKNYRQMRIVRDGTGQPYIVEGGRIGEEQVEVTPAGRPAPPKPAAAAGRSAPKETGPTRAQQHADKLHDERVIAERTRISNMTQEERKRAFLMGQLDLRLARQPLRTRKDYKTWDVNTQGQIVIDGKPWTGQPAGETQQRFSQWEFTKKATKQDQEELQRAVQEAVKRGLQHRIPSILERARKDGIIK